MTLMIEQVFSGHNKFVLRMCGRMQREHVDTIKGLIGTKDNDTILDLLEVMLVDRDAVIFLAACQRKGIELRNCPAFLREWIAKEQLHKATGFSDCQLREVRKMHDSDSR
jgi:hypothetical protein